MTDPTQMTDISSKPSHSSPDTPDTSSTDGQDHTSLLTHKRLKKFYILGVPILSLLVGGALLLIEVVIIILVLADPEALGIAEDVALTAAQRGVLGAVSIVMLIEAVILGVIDIGTNRKKTRSIKEKKKSFMEELHTGEEDVKKVLRKYIKEMEAIMHRSGGDIAAEEMLKQELDHHTLRYAATLVFELVSFLWKWALALLVISNNWLSVGVTIAGGVVYPIVVFWQKAIKPTP